MFQSQAITFVEILSQQAAIQPDSTAYIFLQHDQENVESKLTYRKLDQQARTIATILQSRCLPGDRALLIYPPGLEFIAAFFGCLYAGVVAVPAYPPRRNRNLSRVEAIVANADAAIVLTTTTLSSDLTQLTGLDCLTTDNINLIHADAWKPAALDADTLAFLQYTSGSTGAPKGVMVSHGNIISNQQMIKSAFQHDKTTIFVGWLPLFHDMGLIGNVLQPLYLGIPCILMSPTAFLQRPIRWLQAISDYRATTSGGPNFAYDLCVDRISAEQKTTLDLSCWNVAFNGAEPIRAETLQRFSSAFADCGFRPESFYPCYGMAETTLLVSGGIPSYDPVLKSVQASALEQHQVVPMEQSHKGSRTLVGCGRTILAQDIIIVDPQTLVQCLPGQIGEIWVAGNNVAQGYWNCELETQETFAAYLSTPHKKLFEKAQSSCIGTLNPPILGNFDLQPPPELAGRGANTAPDGTSQTSSKGPYLRTGDLGFLDPDSELFITGRLKEVIIIRGRNYYPQDIERVAEKSHPALRLNSSAAFSVEIECQERLIIVHEVERSYLRQLNVAEIASAIRGAVSSEFDLEAHSILFLKTNSILKTSSGKIQRRGCRSAFLNGTLNMVAQDELGPVTRSAESWEQDFVAPQTPSEELIANLFSTVLDIHPVGLHQSFFELGGHSLLATQLISRLRQTFELEIPQRTLFEAPTVFKLAQMLGQLRQGDAGLTLPPITPAPRDGQHLPLSWAQERLWFLVQLEGQSATYNLPVALQLTGKLNMKALKQAFASIVERHEVLRTRFPMVDGSPVQEIVPDLTVALEWEQCFHLSTQEWQAQVKQAAQEAAQTPFDLAADPLLRVNLLQHSEEEAVLLVTLHHIISDGWSVGVLMREVAQLYQATVEGKEPLLDPLPIQYGDYALWQQRWLRGEVLDHQLTYWQEQLAGAPTLLQLPTDYPRPAVQSHRGAHQSFHFSIELTHQLERFSQDSGVTLFMTLLAGFGTLLYRYSGQCDFLIGSPIANRNRAEIEPLIGCFFNILVLRFQLQKDPSFAQLLRQVREITLDSYAHQDAKVAEALQPERSLSHAPLFQVMFILQNTPQERLDLPGVTLTPFASETLTTALDLTLSMEVTASGLVGNWEYCTDLFKSETIVRMSRNFQQLLESVVSAPEKPVSRLPLLTAGERYQLLVEWNDTAVDYPQDKCIHQLFEAQVERSPDQIAVVFGDEQLSYQELNARANQLARYLQSLGVGSEVLVGICVERSLDMLVGLLGILKAGGAYLPLDPTYPPDRLQFMFRDTQVAVLVTQVQLLKTLPQHHAQIVALDGDWHSIAQLSSVNLPHDVKSDNLAYVIYTSGSTGTPKGVMIPHNNLVNAYLAWEQAYQLSTETSSHLQMASFSFDVFTGDWVRALCSGGKLVLCLRELLLEPARLYSLMRQEKVDCAEFVPAVLRNLINYLEETEQDLQFMRVLVAGSDSWYVEEFEKLRSFCAVQSRLISSYGVTEATIDSSYFETAAIKLSPQQLVPIGRPFANTQLYILDAYFKPVPIGVIGELFICGAGVARGYWNLPNLTAERFIPISLGDNSHGNRGYRTGDLARYLPDGTIELLGRTDDQIKIRGFRVELGEIEGLLSSHPQVKQVAVIVREDELGNKQLVAYIVTVGATAGAAAGVDQQAGLSLSELRFFLAEKLPSYMVPSAFVILEVMPLTPNGKVDRKALPIPNANLVDVKDFVAPQTPSQELIANLFSTVLDVHPVGQHQSFFEIGGHSLLATQLISRLRQTFELEIPLRTLFEAPTVFELDQHLCQLRQGDSSLRLPSVTPVPRDGQCLPLSWAQERLWFLEQLEGQSATYNLPEALRLTGKLNVDALEQAFKTVVERHEVLRTRFPTVDGSPIQEVIPDQTVVVKREQWFHLSEDEWQVHVQQATQEEAQSPFDLATDPLLRVSLLQHSEEEAVLLVTMHHIISDGWSVGVLIREMAQLYQAKVEGKESPLEPLPIQYGDYALWQQRWLRGEVLEQQLAYWQQQLADTPTLLQLPTDYPRPAVQSYRGAHQDFHFSAELTQQLKRFSQDSGVTLFMLLLAGFGILLYRYSGQCDLLIGSPIANRNRAEIEPLIGFFVNTLVLRLQIENNPSFAEVLHQVRETTLDSYAHQDAPFEQVVETLQPDRSLSHAPLFQVMFGLQNAPQEELDLPGVTLTPLASETLATKFDLTLLMEVTVSGLVGSWEYSTDLFEPETIERMSGHLQQLLEAAMAAPEESVSRLPLLTESERHQLLVEWNDTAFDCPQDQCIHQLFEAQVEQTPNSVAVVFEDQQLSYGELNERANQLAHYLQRLGVGPEVLVGICVERSLDLVVGLLGILKAGGVYVPLDPTYPSERLSYILNDASVEILLTQRALDNRLPTNQTKVVYLDDDPSSFPTILSPVVCLAKPTDLAYVIYTSGSTGQPKGAMVEHLGCINHCYAKIHDLSLKDTDTIAQTAPIGFDISVWQIVAMLLVGGKVEIIKNDTVRDPDQLLKEIQRRKISILQVVPSLLSMMLEVCELSDSPKLSYLRWLVVTGEAFPTNLLDWWFEHYPNISLINAYGPAECSDDVTHHLIYHSGYP
ncbi:MAG: amino acid adenylation domain-containing protein [Symploca sp. SIO2C1]|nr:amino acid adenylation domain-containing protein [Symploca sp. SIO2C1]